MTARCVSSTCASQVQISPQALLVVFFSTPSTRLNHLQPEAMASFVKNMCTNTFDCHRFALELVNLLSYVGEQTSDVRSPTRVESQI